MSRNPYRGGDDPHKDPEGLVTRPDQLQVRASTEIWCKEIADRLHKHYPGWLWAVQPDERGGVFNIFCWDLHDEWGYVILMRDVIYDPRCREAIRAGGEILSRFGARPGPKSKDALMNVTWAGKKAYPILDDRVASRQQLAKDKLRRAEAENRVRLFQVEDKLIAGVKE